MADSKDKLSELINNESFVRWIHGTANIQEQKAWEQWEEEDQNHRKIKREALFLYELPLRVTDGSDVETQLARLDTRIDSHNKILVPLNRNKKHNKSYYRAAAAAVVLLLVTVSVLVFYQSQSEKVTVDPLYTSVEVGYGEMGLLNISDGSSIRLNANSTLRYSPRQFNTSHIEVWLKGEGYFSITRNPNGEERSFIVHTSDGDVQVLGTKFNVNTRFNRTRVVLVRGRVEVALKDSLQNTLDQQILQPGEAARFTSDQSDIYIHQVDTTLYTAWMEGKLGFEDTPLKEVVQNIEATYGVSIAIEDRDLLNEKISGSVQNPNLETLLKGLEKALKLNIRQKADGEFVISRR